MIAAAEMPRLLTLSRNTGRTAASSPIRLPHQRRTVMMMGAAAAQAPKKEGDISSVFVSLSGGAREPLPDRFRVLKESLVVAGHEDAVIKSWGRLLRALREENEAIAAKGPAIIPSLEFKDLEGDVERLEEEIKKRGAAVVRGVVDEKEARAYKEEVEEYVRKNPGTKAFPADDPQVYELYWSLPQLKARAHPNMLKAQSTLMRSLWNKPPSAAISLQPLTYADRLRIRQPGDATFALGPHIDGGSVERWEREGYGRAGTYDAVFRGDWEGYDPWDVGARVEAVQDLYNGAGACSMFRMFQGWLSMSAGGPREGTLLVNPLVRHATAYVLLRPFFRPVRPDAKGREMLREENWAFEGEGADGGMSSELQGATPGHGQELTEALHPHLELGKTMVHVPPIKPGDFVVWHADLVHAVDTVHEGKGDSSVMYIPVCAATDLNAGYLGRQREAFLAGLPGPDFPGGKGESEHVGRPGEEAIRGVEARRAMGLEKLEVVGEGEGERALVERANRVLGF